MRILLTPKRSAAYNMAADEILLEGSRRQLPAEEIMANGIRRQSESIALRLFSWNPAAVSIGYGQYIDSDIHSAKCEEFGIDIVRRITGGKAVLHDQELSYSLIIPENHAAWSSTSSGLFRKVGEALLEALRQFSIPGHLAQDARCGIGDGGDACFSSTGRFEITVYGRKLIGSAQRRARGVILQHGSILLGPSHRRLPLLMPAQVGAHYETLVDRLNNHTISVAEIRDRVPTFEEWAEKLVLAFLEHLETDGHMDDFDDREEMEIERAIRQKYGHVGWTHRRTA